MWSIACSNRWHAECSQFLRVFSFNSVMCFLSHIEHTAVTVYRCLHGLAPPYLAVDCVPVTSLPSRRHLRAESGCLAVTGTMTTLGSRNFAVAGAKVWNSLPLDQRLLSRSLRTFGHKLKHYLFVSEPWAHLRSFKFALYKLSHYYYYYYYYYYVVHRVMSVMC